MAENRKNESVIPSEDLMRKSFQLFSRLSVRYPASEVFPAAEISLNCRGNGYTPKRLLDGFMSDTSALEKLTAAVNIKHSGKRTEGGKAIPAITSDQILSTAVHTFLLAEDMMAVSQWRLHRLLKLHNTEMRGASEKAGLKRIKEWKL